MISENFAKAYQKQYEAEVPENAGPPRDEQAYLNRCLRIYEKFVKDSPLQEQIRLWLVLLSDPAYLGFRRGFSAANPELLHNALYQSAIIKHACLIWASGGDHLSNVWIALDALAAGLNDRIPLLLPEKLGMSVNGHPATASVTNLLMALWYQRTDYETHARQNVEKVLKTRQPDIYHAAVRYLLALLDEDATEAGAQLELYCGAVPRVKEFGVTKLCKMFWPKAHGLYNLAFAVWEKDKAPAIPMPKPDCFCNALAEWQIAHAFHPGKLFFEYPEPIDLVNRILACTPPEYTLCRNEQDKTKYHIDAAHFKAQFIEKIFQEING